MANESTSSTLSELYTEIVAEALFVASEQSIMRPLVRNYAVTGGGKSVEVPIYSAVSAAAVSEASDLTNTAINTTSETITCSENGKGQGKKHGIPVMMGEGDHTWIETVIMDDAQFEAYQRNEKALKDLPKTGKAEMQNMDEDRNLIGPIGIKNTDGE